jgi:hypothetical protein
MRTSLVLLSVLSLVACSKVKELDQRTENLEKSTQKVSKTTNEMQETTSVMYQQIRSKEAEDTRDEKFTILTEQDADMGARFAAAGVYFKSFEFQLWSNNRSFDNERVRETLYEDAATEFVRRIIDIYEKINLAKMTPVTNRKMEQSFYALAATVHLNHHFQDEVALKSSKKAISFYDLIKVALLNESNGVKLKHHEEILVSGVNKEIMTELVKARMDILSALALRDMTDKRQMTLTQKAQGAIFKMTGGRFGSIVLPETYDQANEPTKDQIEKYLKGAIEAKAFLKEINVSKPLEKTVKSALGNIELEKKTDEKAEDPRREKILSLIDELLQ